MMTEMFQCKQKMSEQWQGSGNNKRVEGNGNFEKQKNTVHQLCLFLFNNHVDIKLLKSYGKPSEFSGYLSHK